MIIDKDNSYIILVYFSNDLLLMADGQISVYAIKEWAARNSQDLDRAIQKFFPMYDARRFKDEYTLSMMTPGGYSFGTDTYADFLAELGYAKEFFDEVVAHPENDEGFWDGFTSQKLAEFIPFFHSVLKISRLYDQMRVTRKALKGGTLTTSEELLLKAVAALHQVNALKEKPFWYSVGEGVAEAIPFIGEFIITAPIGLGAGSVVEKAVETGVRKMAINYAEKQLVKYIIKGVGVLAGAFAQTLANPLDIQQNIMRYGLDIVTMAPNADGSFTIEVKPSDNSNAEAAWKGFITSYVNVFTERLGGVVLPFVGGKITSQFSRFVPMVARDKILTSYLKQTAAALNKYAGFKGILGEYEEEVYAQILESLLKGEQLKWDAKDQLKTFTVVAILGGGMRGVQSVFISYEILRTFRMDGRKIVLPAEVYTLLTQLTNESKMAEFKEKMETLGLNDKQKSLALLLAQQTLNIENEISVESEEMVRGQKPENLPQTMNELVTLVLLLYRARKGFVLAQQNNEVDHTESILLVGNTAESTIPLLLFELPQVDLWIEETENAIGLVEGLSIAELKKLNRIPTGIEANIQFWLSWQTGWRPYLEKGKTLSRESQLSLTGDGRVNCNNNLLISTRLFQYLVEVDTINLQRLLSASLAPAENPISPEVLEAFNALKGQNTLEESESGSLQINNEIEFSPEVLAQLIPNARKAKEGAFLFDRSQELNIDRSEQTSWTPEDLQTFQDLHPASQLLEVEPSVFLLNNQVRLSTDFIKQMLLTSKADLQELMDLSHKIEQNGNDATKLAEQDRNALKKYYTSSGYRLRFRFQYETEVDAFIQTLGIQADPRFVELWKKVSFSERLRFWDLVNEIGGYDKNMVRSADKAPHYRQMAMSFALDSKPNSVDELVSYYQYVMAEIKDTISQFSANYSAELQKITGGKKQNKWTAAEKTKVKALNLRLLGQEDVSKKQLKALLPEMGIKGLQDATNPNQLDPTKANELHTEIKEGKVEMDGRIGQKQIDPNLDNLAAAKAIQDIEGLGFADMMAAVYHVKKHHHELPPELQDNADKTKAYIFAAQFTVQVARQINVSPDPLNPGGRVVTYVNEYYSVSEKSKYSMTAIVKINADGKLSLATLMIRN